MAGNVAFQLAAILENRGAGLLAQLFSGKDPQVRFPDPHLEADQRTVLNPVPIGSFPVGTGVRAFVFSFDGHGMAGMVKGLLG
jgi:hypothetical protein